MQIFSIIKQNAENKNLLTPLTLFTEFGLFITFSMETVPVYNFKTISDIFTKLNTYKKYCQLMVREYLKHKFTFIFDEGMARIGVGGGGGRETSVFVSETNHLV